MSSYWKKKTQVASKKEAGGDAKHIYFLLCLVHVTLCLEHQRD